MAKRVNTKISDFANDWLDKKSEEMALTKSALINIAVENYIKEVEVTRGFPKLLKTLEEHGIKIDEI